MNKSYDLVDLFKLIGSLLIFAMHIQIFSCFGYNVQLYGIDLIARWGVPFFFIISAFLLFENAENGKINHNQLVHYIKRIGFLYLIWFIINIPYIIYVRLLLNNILSFKTWILFIKNTLVSSSFMGSWYLVSCVFSSWFIYTLSKRLSTNKILVISFCIYLLCILTSAYSGFLPQIKLAAFKEYIFSPANSLLCGCLFFAIGKYLAEKKEEISKIDFKTCIIFIAFFYVLYYLEIYILKHYNVLGTTDAAFFLIPLSFYIAILCINSKFNFKNSRRFRKISTIVYLGQGSIIVIAGLFGKVLKLNSILVFVIGLVMIIVFAFAILLFQKKTTIKWAKYLT